MNAAELIINPDGSVYHLNLLPDEVADTIVFVGDQDRVPLVSRHFDSIEVKKHKREFVTHTGHYRSHRITVMSTGIGTDNIDIVLNELDALANIDFKTQSIRTHPVSLKIIRIGTSGSIHPDVPEDSWLISRYAIGTDALGPYYGAPPAVINTLPERAYIAPAFDFDTTTLEGDFHEGVTLTCPGFYHPQGRQLRLHNTLNIDIGHLYKETIHDVPVTNIEMETAGIYALAHAFGHRAISFNAILAHRLKGTFSKDPQAVIDQLIEKVLHWTVHHI